MEIQSGKLRADNNAIDNLSQHDLPADAAKEYNKTFKSIINDDDPFQI